MKCFFCGIPAYVTIGNRTADTRRPSAIEADGNTELRVIPLDSTPPYFARLNDLSAVAYPEIAAVRIPRSPLAYARPARVLHVLSEGEYVFRVDDNGVTALSIEGTHNAEFILPDGLVGIRSRCTSDRRKFALSAQLGTDPYLFVAIDGGDGWHIAVNGRFRRIEQHADGTLLTLRVESASGLAGNVDVYDAEFRRTETYPVYTGVADVPDPALMLFDLFALGRNDEASKLLSRALLADMSVEDAAAFFVPYTAIRPAEGAPQLYALHTDDTHAELYEFDYADGFVDDMREARHPLAEL